MIFGKHINRYYLKYGWMLVLGLAALVMVDFLQLEIPKLYRMVIDGMSYGYVAEGGAQLTFDMTFLVDRICMPMVKIILAMVFGRFLWRICFFGSAVQLEEDLRNRMFSHAKELSRQYYQVNKVGDLMSLFTNDLDTVQECFGWGVMMFFDAVLLGLLAVTDMWQMNPLLTVLSMIPMSFLLASATIVGKRLMKKWDTRQAAFSKLSDFSQESFSGIAVIKAFVKEAKELWAFKQLNVENGSAFDLPFHGADGTFACLCASGWQGDDQAVGYPPGGIFQAVGFLPGEFFRYCCGESFCERIPGTDAV
jgi:ATP-binding cassette subfamily B protein